MLSFVYMSDCLNIIFLVGELLTSIKTVRENLFSHRIPIYFITSIMFLKKKKKIIFIDKTFYTQLNNSNIYIYFGSRPRDEVTPRNRSRASIEIRVSLRAAKVAHAPRKVQPAGSNSWFCGPAAAHDRSDFICYFHELHVHMCVWRRRWGLYPLYCSCFRSE